LNLITPVRENFQGFKIIILVKPAGRQLAAAAIAYPPNLPDAIRKKT
jgi:hypothetical protein